MPMKGLYVHIPFCEYICHYCDFVKKVPKNSEVIQNYLNRWQNELMTYQHHFDTIETIYIGGGTPSMLSEEQLTFLLKALEPIQPIEYTIEINPDSYTEEKGLLLKKYGVNRISLGVQTFKKELLDYVNRRHTKEQIFSVVKHLRSIGFDNISIDLIYAIPGQSYEDLYQDLNHIKELAIDHISCYSLILEEKTYFYHQYLRGNFKPVDEDIEAQMYQIVMEELKKQGFEHYEISNYAKNKKYSKHNLIYWTMGEYIGTGLGAHGFVDGYRTQNERAFSKYQKEVLYQKTQQTKEIMLADELIFGLRKLSGVDLNMIEKKYQINLFEYYPKLKEKEELGLIEIKDNHLRLTKQGLFLGNQVFMVFI